MNTYYPTKYKRVQWLDRTKNQLFYGIAAQVEGKWYNCLGEDDKPMFFPTKKAADARVKELNEDLKLSYKK